MNQALIDLREAAQRLGVHYMTAYRYVRMGRLPATQDGGRWLVDPKDLERLQPGRADSQARRGHAQPEPYRERLRERMLAGDEAGAWKLVETFLVSGGSPQAALVEVLAPAMREVGEGWQRGELSVGDEHRATAVALRLVGRLGPMFVRRGRPRGKVVVASAPGDPHALPAAIVASVLRGHGYAVVELGGNTPEGSVLAEVEAAGNRLRGVVISVSSQDRLEAAQAVATAVRSVAPDTPILIGGPAVTSEEQAAEVGSDGWASDAAALAELLAVPRRGSA
ncbi:MAG TPA: B12-binding domain-containing protein [Jiangellales bacterium]|nr:B12-binding domain-containing protein [Jiangellales bacterium]